VASPIPYRIRAKTSASTDHLSTTEIGVWAENWRTSTCTAVNEWIDERNPLVCCFFSFSSVLAADRDQNHQAAKGAETALNSRQLFQTAL